MSIWCISIFKNQDPNNFEIQLEFIKITHHRNNNHLIYIYLCKHNNFLYNLDNLMSCNPIFYSLIKSRFMSNNNFLQQPYLLLNNNICKMLEHSFIYIINKWNQNFIFLSKHNFKFLFGFQRITHKNFSMHQNNIDLDNIFRLNSSDYFRDRIYMLLDFPH